ncbi:type IV secretory system conjugative DNA transfer family protein, partial [Escherichia coli]
LELGKDASLSNAQRYINSMDDNSELLKSLRQSENETVSNIAKEITRTAKSDNLLASIMTAVSKAFEFLDDDRIRKTTSNNGQGFYLKDVLMKPKQAVFLQFDQKYKNSTSTLFGAMVAHTMRILQANQNRKAVFLALDEIINCAPIPKFTDLLNTIR